MEEHPIKQKISGVDIHMDTDGDILFYIVGRNGITHIEPCQKSGMHSNIPYIRVWKEDVCVGEFCQHQIIGVYFEEP